MQYAMLMLTDHKYKIMRRLETNRFPYKIHKLHDNQWMPLSTMPTLAKLKCWFHKEKLVLS
jgi:hypothetical protein